jgi:hypothetical protein
MITTTSADVTRPFGKHSFSTMRVSWPLRGGLCFSPQRQRTLAIRQQLTTAMSEGVREENDKIPVELIHFIRAVHFLRAD